MKLVRKFRKKIVVLTSFLYASLLNQQITYAATIKDSKAVTGTTDLFNDLSSAALIIAPALATILVIWQFIKLQGADDDSDSKRIHKKIKMIIISAAAVFVVGGIIKVVVSYYK